MITSADLQNRAAQSESVRPPEEALRVIWERLKAARALQPGSHTCGCQCWHRGKDDALLVIEGLAQRA